MKRLAIICLVIIVGGVTAFWFSHAQGVRVVIHNDGTRALGDLKLTYTGGTNSLRDLAPGSSWTSSVVTTGESSLQIEYVNADQLRLRSDVDIYLEPSSVGKVEVHISDSGGLSWSEQVH